MSFGRVIPVQPMSMACGGPTENSMALSYSLHQGPAGLSALPGYKLMPTHPPFADRATKVVLLSQLASQVASVAVLTAFE